MATRMIGTSHQRRRRRGGVGVQASVSPLPPPSGPASTISSVVSGLMVSLAVVVAAILAVVVLVFSDQTATGRAGTRRGLRGVTAPSSSAATRPAASNSSRAGPPPADVLQRQLALPSVRRTP